MIRLALLLIAVLFTAPAHAACSSPIAPAGIIIYVSKYAALQYCNDTDWVMMGTGSWNPPAVNFADGATDYLARGGVLTGVADGKQATGSLWFRTSNAGMPSGTAMQELFVSTRNADNFAAFGVGVGSGPDIRVTADTGGSTSNALLMNTTALTPNDGNWHHVLFSFDMADTAKRHLYIDDVSDMSVTTYVDTVLNFVELDHYIGRGKGTAANSQFSGDLADLWMDFGTYIDLSIEANRRKFISAAGMPIYLGPDGSIPTGDKPDIFLSGDDVLFASNRGTGGGFTENGAITYASSQPGDPSFSGTALPESGSVTSVDLDGVWHVEVEGNYAYAATNLDDSLTIIDVSNPSAPIQAGTTGTQALLNLAMDVEVSGNYAYVVAQDADSFVVVDISNKGAPSIVANIVHATDLNGARGIEIAGNYAYVSLRYGNGVTVVDISNPLSPSIVGTTGSVTPQMQAAVDLVVDGNYAYVAAFDSDALSVVDISNPASPSYVATTGTVGSLNGVIRLTKDGNYVYAASRFGDSVTVVDVSNPLIPSVITSFGDTSITDDAADVVIDGDHAYVTARITANLVVYDVSNPASPVKVGETNPGALVGPRDLDIWGGYAYVADYGDDRVRILDISYFSDCANPDGTNSASGTLVYNSDFNVMQYCNGVEWVAMGPIGGTPPTSGQVAYFKLDETAGISVADSGGVNAGTWSGEPAVRSAGGKVGTALDFDGADDHVTAGSDASIDDIFVGGGTVSAWINVTSCCTGTSARIVSKEVGNSASDGWNVHIDSGGSLSFARGWTTGVGGRGRWDAGAGSITFGQWHHVAIIYNEDSAANDPLFYIDGILKTGITEVDAPSGAAETDAAQTLVIGDTTGFTRQYNGLIDELRLYNRSMTESEIRQLYYYGLSGGLGDVSANCTSPLLPESSMFYNVDYNVMQYCNGERWIGIGK